MLKRQPGLLCEAIAFAASRRVLNRPPSCRRQGLWMWMQVEGKRRQSIIWRPARIRLLVSLRWLSVVNYSNHVVDRLFIMVCAELSYGMFLSFRHTAPTVLVDLSRLGSPSPSPLCAQPSAAGTCALPAGSTAEPSKSSTSFLDLQRDSTYHRYPVCGRNSSNIFCLFPIESQASRPRS